ncbi:hypothetical protein TSOC_000755 [Tetrabaena socialis]|uniref:Methyltransferase FkbM domain-containing protein n=1 Tax=Tetrabaena socialis TaxID=47790 RepID=A0A2J8AIJ8_9CHLO|nr:hypothetical protein TSOC_000755 [Tetrabaena socialis]|eukprot:PNH12344.1 hypothetical protein TSOC_000755 [Tetrabaena socialis]
MACISGGLVACISGGRMSRIRGGHCSPGQAASVPAAASTAACAEAFAAAAAAAVVALRLKAHAVEGQVFCEETFPLLEVQRAATSGGGGGGGGQGVAAREVLPGASIYVYSGDDAVSTCIRDGLGWENDVLEQVLWAMQQPLPAPPGGGGAGAALGGSEAGAAANGSAAGAAVAGAAPAGGAAGAAPARILQAAAAAADGAIEAAAASLAAGQQQPSAAAANQQPSQPPPPLFVDVGANVGWLSVNMAVRGYRVAAFEGMATNVALGDGITMCGVASEAEAAAKVPPGYALRGRLPIHRLDSVLQPPPPGAAAGHANEIKVLKMDVEGYEPHVLAGLGALRPWYLATEYNPDLLRGVNAGYRAGQRVPQRFPPNPHAGHERRTACRPPLAAAASAAAAATAAV